MKILERNFSKDLQAIFAKHSGNTTEKRVKKLEKIFVPADLHRFNVVKVTEFEEKVVIFGITMADALRGINHKYQDTDLVKYRVVPAEAV